VYGRARLLALLRFGLVSGYAVHFLYPGIAGVSSEHCGVPALTPLMSTSDFRLMPQATALRALPFLKTPLLLFIVT
jgi:hypothetical protein